MDPNAYVITFPMLLAGLFAVGSSIAVVLVKKWINDSEKAADSQAKSIHDSFQTVHLRIDKMRDEHAEDQRQIADLRVELAKAVTREEVNELRNHIDVRFQELLKAIAPRSTGG